MSILRWGVVSFVLLIVFPIIGYTAQNIVRIAPLTISIKSTNTDIAGTAEKIPNTPLVGRESLVVYNADHATETIHCGDSNVTTSIGIPLDVTTPSMALDWDDSIDLYCISDGTSVSVRTLESK